MPSRSKIWDIVDEFFQARALFMQIYDAYERGVLRHAEERGVDRKDLRLDADDVSALLDNHQLADLRGRHLVALKETSHQLFRTDEATDIFDRYITDAFHEVSILMQEHLKVHRVMPAYTQMDEDEEEVEAILDEVHQLFPNKVHHVYALFQKAKERLEQLIHEHDRNTVLLRSLYLFGDELLGGVYDGGLEEFYGYLYPDLGAPKGYLEVGRSFLESGFLEHAREALGKCLVLAQKATPRGPELEEIVKEARELVQRAKRVPVSPPR